MAATSTIKRGEIQQTVYHGPDWHGFVYDIMLLHLGVLESWNFRQVFRTHCESWPSSWLCEMEFQKVSDDGVVCLPFTLRRTDSIGSIVDVRMALRVRDSINRHLFVSRTTQKERNHSGVVIEETFVENIPLPEDRRNFNQTLFVNLFIYIMSCHSQ